MPPRSEKLTYILKPPTRRSGSLDPTPRISKNITGRMIDMDLTDPGKWRKSKVESFIRRHLNILDLGVTRYYEMCMWDNKGTLVPSYALLMDNSIILTENPPKNVVHIIPLSAIKDISLIADRHSLIKGKNNNSYVCQHVSIVYEPSKRNNYKKPFTPDANFYREFPIPSEDRSIISSTRPLTPPPQFTSASVTNLSDEDRESNCTNHSSQTDLSGNNYQYSDISVSPVPSSVPLERNIFPQILIDAYEPTIRINRPSTGSSMNSSNNYYNAWLRSSEKRGHHRHYHLDQDNRNDSSSRNSPLSSSYSPETRTPWSDWMSMSSSERKVELKSRKARLMTEMNSLNEGDGRGEDANKEVDLQNAIEDTRRSRWFRRKGKASSTSRERSTEKRPTTATTHQESSDDENEDDANNNRKSTTKNKEYDGEKKDKKKGKKPPQQKLDNMQLYFYQRDSAFVNELSLVWNRQQLKNTEEQEVDVFGGLSKSFWVNKSLRAAEKIVSRVAQDWDLLKENTDEILSLSLNDQNSRLTKNMSYEELLRKVVFLHKCLMRYEHLKYLCWKNTVIMSGLIHAMMACLEPLESNRDLRSIDVQVVYWDKVATYAILMDIFRTLFEACSVTWFKDTELLYRNSADLDDKDENALNEWEADAWEHKLTIFDVTRKLLSSILKCPFIPRSCHIPGDHGYGCFVTITDPQKFIKATWLTVDHESSAKMAKLICTAHNASVALLFELLAIAHFLPTLIEKTLVTYGVRQINLERYVRLSVTQIINILWNTRDPINSAQTMILYRQVWNLRILLKHDHKILEFIRQNFSEEFHYYATTKGIKSRIPDQYTIKPKVIEACEQLLEDVMGKPSRRS